MLFIDQIGGRKALVSILSLIIGVIITIIKGDVPANLLQLLEVLSVGFVVGNVGVKALDARRQRPPTIDPDSIPVINEIKEESVSPEASSSTLEARVAELETKLTQVEATQTQTEQTITNLAKIIIQASNPQK